MNEVEKIVYILKASFHHLPNDKALEHIAQIILTTIKEHENG